jgi:hypothetical protein
MSFSITYTVGVYMCVRAIKSIIRHVRRIDRSTRRSTRLLSVQTLILKYLATGKALPKQFRAVDLEEIEQLLEENL